MRRTTTVLAALATGTALTLSTAVPALAAQGTLTVSGRTYTDPAKGCYTGNFWPLAVDNQTDAPVFVYDDDQCRGRVLDRVPPHSSGVFEFGGSVAVPR
ncbi:hypothetical protein ETD83_41150 [Actinomadura soli]|uniref:Uncharacterized protein n=1 Tax=Actinomadura soli TaxID=2508997 RepID=A0A5C4IYZ4_9ACTN|nr:hypothetical protein [Actinomadura soli]TMQ83240.1 hypothetical protein ETD83_41150 [Actinomadura soli]